MYGLIRTALKTVEDIAEKYVTKVNKFHFWCNIYKGDEMKTKCNTCDNEFERTNGKINKINYCSRSCSAKMNNKIRPKRKKEGACKGCSSLIHAGSTWCKECFIKKEKVRFVSNKTKGELTSKSSQLSNKYRQIRHNAAIVAKNHKLLESPCKCGYSKHVQICHIKSIQSFPDDALVSEINHIDNLMALCPNCIGSLTTQLQIDKSLTLPTN